MTGVRRKRPGYSRPAQPRSPRGKLHGRPVVRRRYQLPN